MDTELLKTFLEIHKTRHFGQAADNLYLTQSAVSARIRQLENEMGVKLFTRDRNNIKPTAAGERLAKHAEEMLNTWNRIKIDLAVEDENKTSLSVGAVSSLWDIYLGRWLTRFVDNNKDVVLNCQVLTAESIQQKINKNTLDFGFTYLCPQEEHITILKTLPIKFIMTSSKQGLDTNEAVKDNYIYVDWGTSFSEAHSQRFHDIPTPLMRVDIGRIAKLFIKSRSGTAYLPEAMVKRDIENGVLFKVKGAPVIKREAYIIYNNKNEKCKTMAKEMTD